MQKAKTEMVYRNTPIVPKTYCTISPTNVATKGVWIGDRLVLDLCANSGILSSLMTVLAILVFSLVYQDIYSQDTFLQSRPIQGNLIVTKDRQETIQIELKAEAPVTRIVASCRYSYGQNDEETREQELTFVDDQSNGDIVAGDNIYTSNELKLHYENWIHTYFIRQLDITLEFYDQMGDLQGSDRIFLPYIVIDTNFLAEVPDFTVNYLTADSTIVHIDNAIYIEFEKNIRKYIDADRHFTADFYDEELWMEDVYDSIWQQRFFTDLGSGQFGLDGLNSSVYSFPINGGSGNYYFVENKTGNSSFRSMFENSTVIHELFHMFQPHFNDYLNENIPGNPFYQAGGPVHNLVQFFGQSGFGRTYPLSYSYPNLCPEHFDDLVRTENGWEVTVHGPCDTTGLNLVDGIEENVHSNFELFLMNLLPPESLPDTMYFGTNPESESRRESVTWKFDSLVTVSRDQMTELRELWYTRDNQTFEKYYDADCKNILISFHGSGKLTYEELKVLHLLSDEMVAKEMRMAHPGWTNWGYKDDVYHRYISYEEATLGLGKLTNRFPLPSGFFKGDTCEIKDSICNGQAYSFAGQLLTMGGTYTDTLIGNSGCDGVIILHLSIVDEYETIITDSICHGETYDFNGQALSVAGTYQETFSSAGGCDSVVILHLSVLPRQETNISDIICHGDTYDFNGQALSVAGTYQETFSSAGGCDSIVTLHLSVLPRQETNIFDIICQGETYYFNDNIISTHGTYVDSLLSAVGCDSVVTLHLSILDDIKTIITDTICEGETYDFNSDIISKVGTYMDTLVIASGCDSVVTLELSVLPKSTAFCETTTAKNLTEDFAMLYPNPATDRIYLENLKTSKVSNIRLYNQLGQIIILRDVISLPDQRFLLILNEGCSHGLYYLRYQVGSREEVRPFAIIGK